MQVPERYTAYNSNVRLFLEVHLMSKLSPYKLPCYIHCTRKMWSCNSNEIPGVNTTVSKHLSIPPVDKSGYKAESLYPTQSDFPKTGQIAFKGDPFLYCYYFSCMQKLGLVIMNTKSLNYIIPRKCSPSSRITEAEVYK